MLTGVARPGHLRALTAGASGPIVKDAEPAKLADAVPAVAAGQQVADPELDLPSRTPPPRQIAKLLFLTAA
ncbi:response regulator transcription factor [Streptomyces sp. RP5T]|uniref:response regulator transcription factor n=1 Tax=Streptomyces sp. RP5T TaxID=2490848 RepID=UPI000F64C950|nr:response regulator transcription factor [Streptomyces sp. RP5T]RRR69653.1 DNA-binding response regulator [Streptomyces sp. RP5T]